MSERIVKRTPEFGCVRFVTDVNFLCDLDEFSSSHVPPGLKGVQHLRGSFSVFERTRLDRTL